MTTVTGSYDACDDPHGTSKSIVAQQEYGQIRIVIFDEATQIYLTKEKAREFAKELLALTK